MEIRSIAIDGPSGAGKSTLSKMVAKEFGLIYVDTGAMYRTIGLFVQRNGVGSKDAENVEKLLPEIKIEMKYDETGTQRMILNGEDVSGDIRLPQISIYASDVSAMPAVRAFCSKCRDLWQRHTMLSWTAETSALLFSQMRDLKFSSPQMLKTELPVVLRSFTKREFPQLIRMF